MISLQTHSYFTLLSGTLSIEKIVSIAVARGDKSAILTDKNGMYGLVKFFQECKNAKLKPILGALIDDPKIKDEEAIFIAKNNEGYSQLCKIITARKLQKDFSLEKILKNELENLFVLTSSIELLKNIPNTKNLFAQLIGTKNSKNKTREIYNFARENNIKMVPGHPIYFEKKEDLLLHKTLRAIALRKNIHQLDERDIVDEEYYSISNNEFTKKWKGLPEAVANIDFIESECNVDLRLGQLKFPFFKNTQGTDNYSLLWKISFEGLNLRYKNPTKQAITRLQYEIDVIDELNFTDYFLTVWDLLQEMKKRGMYHIGRGSAANSLVSYCLGVTEIDPIESNLYFERFLNRSRSSPPDIDLDFSWKERDEVIKYIFDKYGYEKVAMISTYVTFRARSAFREVAKVFGMSNNDISKISKFIPWTSAENLTNLSQIFPEAKKLKFDDEPLKTINSIAVKLARFPRHISIHPSGIVIAPDNITNYTALEFANNKGLGLIITQPDMYSIEELGLVKIDILSQRSLGVVRDTISMISKNQE
ncbi:MAG: hypothetical protein C0425_00880 [Chlorobiaceae bacterium]|nr:hypothetical protein [Chlorobiaceae bacterium]MBA4308876.1 hypothetical protein [Chlorobiaceae bacterium]